MQSRASLEGFGVLGANLGAIVQGFGNFTLLASQILLAEGIGKDNGSGIVVFEPNQFYALGQVLSAFDKISKQYGEHLLKQVAQHVPKTAPLPPNITDIDSALKTFDVAYHMQHGHNGRPMFSPATGKMEEGIGHYTYSRTPGKNQIVTVVDSPYPCVFDLNLVASMAQRFQPNAVLTHDTSKPCRKNGGASCTYVINWK